MKRIHEALYGCLLIMITKQAVAQEPFALSTGNYAGVTGVWFNPSMIADSRHKFDINLISTHSYFDNNLVDVKGDALYRGRFFREPYKSDYALVRRDLLELRNEPASARVNALVYAGVQAPLSMMITTGQKSAIAINMRSRIGLQAFNMARPTAQLLYEELKNPALHGVAADNSGIAMNHLRWQEVGFTYSRVLLNTGKHFVKGGFTGKWLMGQAAAFLQSDNLAVTFGSPVELSMQSPLIRYYRSNLADVDDIRLSSFFRDVETNRFGWDAGLTYEFRGRIRVGKFQTGTDWLAGRRDMNKYTLRIAAALIDVGQFSFRKEPFTNDHSAAFNNWDFSDLKAQSFSQFEQAYAQQVQYLAGASPEFNVALPTSLTANVDLHLFRGFYINGAMMRGITEVNRNVQTSLQAPEWYAITPRWESRHIGIYLPYVRTRLHNRDYLGATLRLGPVFVGSSNLGSLLFNDKLPAVDAHAGVKLGITYGKKSKLLRRFEEITRMQTDADQQSGSSARYFLDDRRMRGLDSLLAASPEARTTAAPPAASTQPVVNVVINNYLGNQPADSQQVRMQDGVVVVDNVLPRVATQRPAGDAIRRDSILMRQDAEINYLLNRLARLELEYRDLLQQRSRDSAAIEALLLDRRMLEERIRLLMAIDTTQGGSIRVREASPEPRKRNSLFRRKNRDTEPVQEPVAVNPQTVREAPAVQPQQPLPATVQTYRYIEDPSYQRQLRQTQRSNEELSRELQNIRRQMNAQTAALAAINVGAAAATAPGKETVTVRDTVFVRDTVWMATAPPAAGPPPATTRQPLTDLGDSIIRATPRPAVTAGPDTVAATSPSLSLPLSTSAFFASGSTSLSAAARQQLTAMARQTATLSVPYRLLLTGRTDGTGSAEVNRRIAGQRIEAVRSHLLRSGMKPAEVKTAIQLDAGRGANPQSRRVDVVVEGS